MDSDHRSMSWLSRLGLVLLDGVLPQRPFPRQEAVRLDEVTQLGVLEVLGALAETVRRGELVVHRDHLPRPLECQEQPISNFSVLKRLI